MQRAHAQRCNRCTVSLARRRLIFDPQPHRPTPAPHRHPNYHSEHNPPLHSPAAASPGNNATKSSNAIAPHAITRQARSSPFVLIPFPTTSELASQLCTQPSRVCGTKTGFEQDTKNQASWLADSCILLLYTLESWGDREDITGMIYARTGRPPDQMRSTAERRLENERAFRCIAREEARPEARRQRRFTCRSGPAPPPRRSFPPTTSPRRSFHRLGDHPMRHRIKVRSSGTGVAWEEAGRKVDGSITNHEARSGSA